jgi:subtilisin family serine protease
VAATVGGTTYGVAKGVTLIGVRVLDCDGYGTTAGVIAGIEWVTGHHTGSNPAVANMSLSGAASSALDRAVKNSIADGVTYGVAAGNGNTVGVAQDACKSSPARVPAALTVGATDSVDTKASWSNYGTCLDLFAAGVEVTSAWYSSSSATETISGTSMATPHVVGVAALYLQGSPSAAPATVSAAIRDNATTGTVVGTGAGSPNRLLYSGFIGGGAEPPPPPADPISLTATTGAAVRNRTPVSLAWTGAGGAVGITRNGSAIASSASGPTYTDKVRPGTYAYQVCLKSAPATCSNVVTVTV